MERTTGIVGRATRTSVTRPAAAWHRRLDVRAFGVFAVVVLAARFLPSAGFLISAAAAMYAFQGARQTVQAFTVLGLLLLVGGSGTSEGRWLVLFAGFGRVAYDTLIERKPMPVITWWITGFGFAIGLLTAVSSQLPLVSLLKLVSFLMGASTLVVSFHRSRESSAYWWAWMYALSMFILLASSIMYLTGGGYARNGLGFQGITIHPQTYGPVAATIGAFLFGYAVLGNARGWLARVALGLAVLGTYTSYSRTAFLALGLAIFGTFILAISFRAGQWKKMTAGFVRRPSTWFGMYALIFASLAYSQPIQERIADFMQKGDEVASVDEAFAMSRGELIQRSMANFEGHPWTGIGFGIPSDLAELDLKVGFLGIPTGASIEKGFMPSAVLEEIGIIGAVALGLLLGVLLLPILQHGSAVAVLVATTCLLINMGEMVFFSFGGMGAYLWIWFAFLHVDSLPEPTEHSKPHGRRLVRRGVPDVHSVAGGV